MFLRRLHQTRNGRTYTYYSIVETVRTPGGPVRQVSIPVVAALSAVNRLVDPRSERGIHRWLLSTALPELLKFPAARLTLNHLYRCLSLVEPHKAAIEQHLADQGRDLCAFHNDLLS